jgi:uncharacterized protein YuzE
VYFKQGEVAKSKEVEEGVVVIDLDGEGHLIWIEILSLLAGEDLRLEE